jgi:uncharacterized PurR-regulated membrane protein YhhQ (DUF165 family)
MIRLKKSTRPQSAMPRGAKLATFGMVLAVAAANYLAQFTINDWMTWGTPVIAVTFLINEVTNQLFGATTARRVVLWGFVIALGVSLAIAPWRIAVASASAFLISQLTDIAIFARLKGRTLGRLWWFSPMASSSAASALDTAIFFFIAFAGTGFSWWRLGLGDFAVKLAFDVAMLAPFRMALRHRLVALQQPLRAKGHHA